VVKEFGTWNFGVNNVQIDNQIDIKIERFKICFSFIQRLRRCTHYIIFIVMFLYYVHCASCVCKFSQAAIGNIFHFWVVFWVWEKTMHYIRFKVHSMMSLLSLLKTFRFR